MVPLLISWKLVSCELVNSSPHSATDMFQWTGSALVHVMAWHLLCQAITWTNTDLLSIAPLGTNFSEIWIEILAFSFKKMHLKMLSVKWQPFCIGLNVWTRSDPLRVSSDLNRKSWSHHINCTTLAGPNTHQCYHTHLWHSSIRI